MTLLLLSVLFVCVLGVLHTYVFYPLYLMRARPRVQGKRGKNKIKETWPEVNVLMAAHNEEAVLRQKLESLFAQDYPGHLRFYVGSDNSTDRTNEILQNLAAGDVRLVPTLFSSRQGKPAIINQLALQAGNEGIYVLTDASVMLRPDTITELVRPLRSDDRIGLVDTTMRQIGGTKEGIGEVESTYIDREVKIKRAEGDLWGAMIGPFGGCFALRAKAFRPVPPNFLVDDFFLCMAAYEQGFRGISSRSAVVEEAVGQRLREEFGRKVRISSGNWQNMIHFRQLWWPPFKDNLAFAFFSHKILRWWTPFLMIIGAGAWLLIALRGGSGLAAITLAIVGGLVLGAVLLDLLLHALSIHLSPFRKFRYFLAMNAALLVGFFRYLGGIKSNVWTPSERS